MKRIIVAFVIILAANVSASAQQGRHQVYGPVYNQYGLTPGLSEYSDGYYSVDYGGQRQWFRRGYQPMRYRGYVDPFYYGWSPPYYEYSWNHTAVFGW